MMPADKHPGLGDNTRIICKASCAVVLVLKRHYFQRRLPRLLAGLNFGGHRRTTHAVTEKRNVRMSKRHVTECRKIAADANVGIKPNTYVILTQELMR